MKNIKGVEWEMDSWQELIGWLVGWGARGWIFRGLPDYAYSPVSKLERVLKDSGVPYAEWKTRENLALAFFKERGRLQLSEKPDDRDILGWFSLMQHYGAPTRLSDWSVSPFVASYFAYDGVRPNKKDGSAALWVLNAAACRLRIGSKFPFGRDHLGVEKVVETLPNGQVSHRYPGREITDDDVSELENSLLRQAIEHDSEWPLPLPILRPDRRMAAQQACFVACGRLMDEQGMTAVEMLMTDTSLEESMRRSQGFDIGAGNYLQESLIGRMDDAGDVRWVAPSQIPGNMVMKIRLPHEWRSQVLNSLGMMNITGETLFPGLDGVGKATNSYLGVGAPLSMREYLGL